MNLFSYPTAAAATASSGSTISTHCEVYDADQIENECTKRGLLTKVSCEADGYEWLGIQSNKDTVATATASDDDADDDAESTAAATASALYKRLPDSSWGSSQVWGSTFISVLAMQVYGRVWDSVAIWLNTFENHRTQIEYEDSMIMKQFVFQFINYYFLLMYIAFLKAGAPFAPFMGESAASFGSTSGFNLDANVQQNVVGLSDLEEVPVVSLRDTCALDDNDMPDCMSELCMQLVTLFVFKQVVLQFAETVVPIISNRLGAKVAKPPTVDNSGGAAAAEAEDHEAHSSWIQNQYMKPKFGNNSVGGSFLDFNEMVIQFGFMSLFAVGFPGAAFFALLNNIQEMRSDAHKILNQHQRPPVQLREDIGAWEAVLSFISYIAVITNAVILGFTSQVIYEIFYADGIEPIVSQPTNSKATNSKART